MDLWDSYAEAGASALGSSQILLRTGERWNSSLGRISDRSRELAPNNAIFQKYINDSRYIIARDINYDMLITIHDVNSSATLAARITTGMAGREWSMIKRAFAHVSGPNFEFRAIGLQNGHVGQAGSLEQLRKQMKGRFMEIDLFGTDTRHIAFDTKTGVTYNLLLLNRIYRAGELACQAKREDFEKTAAMLVFV